MATGKQKHQEYQDAVARLGRDLARRAGSACELSGETGGLVAYDLDGPTVEPDLDHFVLVAPTFARALDGQILDPKALRVLEAAVWSDQAPVRRAAVRILEQLDEPWARDAIDNAAMMDPGPD